MVLLRRTALLLAAVLVALVPGPALADGPLRLDNQLTDRADVLGERRSGVADALEDLRRDTGLQLFVVFVHSFDGMRGQDWANETAARSDLGDRDALLAVATRDRSYAYSFDQDYPLTDAQLASVASVAVEPALAQNDWAGAVVGAAEGYRAALAGQPVPPPQITPGSPDTRTDGRGWLVGGLVAVAVAGAAGAGGWVWWRRGRASAKATGTTGEPTTEELSARANQLLIELDNELRSSEQELELARGQYGQEATAAFTAALDAARHDVAEAFRLRMTLDSPEPAQAQADEAARRAVLTEIIRRCEAADQRLDTEADAFDRLRELEPRVEQMIAPLEARRSALAHQLPDAVSTLEDLRKRYVSQALANVATNPTQARERLGFAAAALTRAGDAVSQGKRSQAAWAVRAAEEALGQAETLFGAIGQVGRDLDAARAAIDALLAEVEAEVAAGRAATGADSDGALAAAVAAGEEAAAAARAGLAAPTTDPQAALRRLQEADAALDRALAESHEATQRVVRARGLLDHALALARAEVTAASDYVTTRRGAVGGQARMWLAEAQRQLAHAEALAGVDPMAALKAAQEAHRLAATAGEAARSDVEGWAPAGAWGGGYGRGRTDFRGAFLAALLGGILAGGSHHRPRRGWGGGFGGGFGGGWSGGFGGSGSRARRSGGGRF